jgi:radical SAM superfamily enzyme YgiQ (UPF0313 family)
MKVCLVTAAIVTDFEDPDEAAAPEVREAAQEPQLGVLTLAAVLEQRGNPPAIVNLDRAYYDYLDRGARGGVGPFAPWVARRLARLGSRVYGFSTICSSYPLTVRIAASLKRLAPDCTIVFGGPQATVVDRETLAAFPAVDVILRGEADETFPILLDELAGARRLHAVPGLTWRSPFGIQRNTDAPLVQDLDSIPIPAYHLTGELEGMSYASLELGRGCPFSCTFCSTNDFFRRKFRLKSPAQMLADMRAIRGRYGIRSFKLTHDMFTVDRKRVVEFCEHLIQSGEKFSWSCSARTDCVDPELLDLMRQAGCSGLFFGVETGSQRLQTVIDKGLDIAQAREVIDAAQRLGMTNTVSLISGFPEENQDDLRETLAMYMHATRHPNAKPQINLLAPLAGTPIHAHHKHEMVLEELCSDMSHQGRIQNQEDRDLIRRYPEIFPNFYLLPTPGLDREMLVELREFLLMATVRLRWLMVALHQATSGILDVFLAWRKRRIELYPDLAGGTLRHYYIQKTFKSDFVAFARAYDSPAIRALLDYQAAFQAAESVDVPRTGRIVSRDLRPDDIPVRAPSVHVFDLSWDIQAVIDAIKSGSEVQPASSAVPYRTGLTPGQDISLIRISPLLARGLELCDGRRTAQACIDQLSECFSGARPLRREAAEYLLTTMRSENLIEWRRPRRAPVLTALREAV